MLVNPRLSSPGNYAESYKRLISAVTNFLITREQEKISLTPRESEWPEFLCLHSDKVLKREDILSNVWGKNDFFLGRSMDVFITRLRKHLMAEPSVNIETIHGVGYRFTTLQS